MTPTAALALLAVLVLALVLLLVWRRSRGRPAPLSTPEGFINVVRAHAIPGYLPRGERRRISVTTPGESSARAQLRRQAEAMGANAVLGLRYDEKKQKYRAGTGPKGNAYWKTRVVRVWTGTAVTLARPHEISDATLAAIRRGDRFVIDGSNVMHWSRDQPELRDVLAVIETLKARGARVHVFFDASAGHRLVAGYRGGGDFAHALGLRRSDVTVVDKGVVADVPILQRARATGATVVTQDRYRDHSGLTDGVAILSGRIEDGRVILHPHPPLGA